jgi:hypothetical protein
MALTLSDLDYDEKGHAKRLDCETLAQLTGESVDRLSGLFGGGIVGTLKIRVDEDASLKDYLSDGANVGEAVGPTERAKRRWDIPERHDDTDPNVAKILEAYERLLDEKRDPDHEGEFGFQLLERYARLLGYRWEIDELENYRDFASVYTITPIGSEKNGTIWEYKEIFEGNVFIVDVELTSPIDGEMFSESVGGVIGEEYALEMATELARNVVNQIRQHVRESKREGVK